MSCTDRVEVASSFDLDNKKVTLIDTPGFDDTNMSDTDILNMIAMFLTTMLVFKFAMYAANISLFQRYEQGIRLNGILYLHRISDPRMSGTSRRNFNTFRNLCGDECLSNVVIVTNMWGGVAEEIGDARVGELVNDELFFQPAIRYGAKIRHHRERTQSSAHAIVREVSRNAAVILRIQKELAIEGKDITQTAAGIALDEEMVQQRKKCAEEMEDLRKEMEEAVRAQNTEAVEELTEAQKTLDNNLAKIDEQRAGFVSDYNKGREALNVQIQAMQQQLRRERAETARTVEDISQARRAINQQERDVWMQDTWPRRRYERPNHHREQQEPQVMGEGREEYRLFDAIEWILHCMHETGRFVFGMRR